MVRAEKKTTEKKAEKKVAEKKVATKKVEAPAPTPVVDAPVVDAPVVTEPVASDIMAAKMAEFGAKLQQLAGLFGTIKTDFKTLEKSTVREIKTAQKAANKGRRNNANRKPSGFVKPTLISDELATFLGKEKGSMMARTEVSRELNVYINLHSLKNKDNGRIIHPDAKLTKLLNIGKDEELTYFNLQRYMKHHFPKTPVVA